MNDATYYNWKAKYAGLTVSDLKRLKSLEEESRRLKHIVAEQALDNWALKRTTFKKLLRLETKRLAVSHASTSLGLSVRRACLLVGLSRSVYDYSLKPVNDNEIREKIRQLAQKRRRFGSPRIYRLLCRQSLVINHKRVERITGKRAYL